MLAIASTDSWRATHPGSIVGVLELRDLQPAGPAAALHERKREIEAGLRERYRGFTRKDFLALPVMAAYDRYYRRFDKTYHVQLQLESIVLKGKGLPAVSSAVDANFMAEVETLVLTAGHDADRLAGPIVIDVSRDDEQMTQMNGTTRPIRAGDMVMRDADGIACSIIYGQDARSPISPTTTRALYVAYAPPGVGADAVERQLTGIEAHVRLFAPGVTVEQRRLLTAD
jgi:DNA/RNA-binding domain of Phe-tRNA-synthetase-like protein